ncbi:hypothetical protein ACJX0J_003577, partial [Zea mays]
MSQKNLVISICSLKVYFNLHSQNEPWGVTLVWRAYVSIIHTVTASLLGKNMVNQILILFVSGILFLEFWALFLFLGAHTQFWALILAQFWALFLCNKDIDRVKLPSYDPEGNYLFKTYLWQGDLKYELVNLFTLKQQCGQQTKKSN